MPFVKLDTGILDSSLWSEPAQTCKCWITLLAMANSDGFIQSTAPGIARRANLGLADTEKALEMFESPDIHSRSLNDEGKRIMRVDGGYQIVNYDKYRARDYTAAERMRRKRERDRVTRNGCDKTVTLRKQKQSTEAEEEKKARPRNQNEVVEFCVSIGLTISDGEAMWLDWQDRGYGKTKDWKAKIRKWKIYGYHPSQKNQLKNATKADYKRNYLPPARVPTDEELTHAREIARLEASTLRAKLKAS